MVTVHMRIRETIPPEESSQGCVSTTHGSFAPILQTVIYMNLFSDSFIFGHIRVVSAEMEVPADSFLNEKNSVFIFSLVVVMID